MSTDNSGLIVSALESTDPALAASIDARNSWKQAIIQRGARVALFRNYEHGDHRASMQTEIRKMLRLREDDAELNKLNINYCKVVVDKMAGRIFVLNIATDTDASKQWLIDTLTRNKFDAQQTEWWRAAVRDGNAYVMVDPDTALWTSEPAYDGFSGIIVVYDDMTRDPMWACKLWSEADTQDVAAADTSRAVIKLVVYQPDRVSYWIGDESGQEVKPDNIVPVNTIIDRGNGFAAVVDSETEFTNTRPWPVKSRKLPIISLVNQRDNYTSYGTSELHPVITLQDSLNSIQSDKIMASKFGAFKLLWSIGFEIDVDGIMPGGVINLVLKDKGENIVTHLTQEQVEFLKAVRVGQFDATDISQYTNQIEKETQQISNVSQTPIYGVTAEGNLSGEALKQLEIGLLGKVERFQHQNTDAIKELITLTAEIQNTFEGENAPAFGIVNVIWKSPELLDVNARIATLVTLREKSPGLFADEFYIKRIGVLLGMSQEDINTEIENAKTQGSFNFGALVAGGLVGNRV
jgi:hypothetical protein